MGITCQSNVLIYEEEGHLLDTWGAEYPGGHGLSLGKTAQGEECLSIVDGGWYWRNEKWNRQQGRVTQTDLPGRVLLDIGQPSAYGAYEPGMNDMPTETAVGPDGSVDIADGYGSNFILRFDTKGKHVGKFGGTAPTYVDGALQPLARDSDRLVHHGHDVCPDPKGNLIVCQWNADKTYPVRFVKVYWGALKRRHRRPEERSNMALNASAKSWICVPVHQHV